MTQVELASILKLTPGAVCLWESGKTAPSSDRLPSIARACGVTLRVFFGPLPRARSRRRAG